MAYCGPAKEAVEYFSSVGLHCAVHYNPADFISEFVCIALWSASVYACTLGVYVYSAMGIRISTLSLSLVFSIPIFPPSPSPLSPSSSPMYPVEMVTQPESRQVLIGPDPQESDSLVQRKWWHKFLPFDNLKDYCHDWRAAHKSPVPSADREESEVSCGEVSIQENVERHTKLKEDEEGIQIINGGSDPTIQMSGNCSEDASIEELASICVEDRSDRKSEKKDDASSSSGSDHNQGVISPQEIGKRKWVVPWYWQFLVLAHRNFKQTYKTLLLSWLLWVQVSNWLWVLHLCWLRVAGSVRTVRMKEQSIFKLQVRDAYVYVAISSAC